ncbi:MAG: peptide ABC transporter substrate-binding protein [Lachnospiraceae bacterium]|nr:peptide ABC transporter substrate-binding protein [Lachnospiraceae bacterium]MBR6349481.1 peptide ABC transporter substrate-binding protein [Lachnospiraceae bacterium]
MKKFLVAILAAAMVIALAACSGGGGGGQQGGGEDTTPAEQGDNGDAAKALVSAAFIDPVSAWGQYDAMIAQIKSETDYAKRTQLMHEAEDVLMSNGCVIPLYYYNDVYMMKDYVEGVYANMFATKFFMYAKLTNGQDTFRIQLSSEPDYLDPALNSSVDGACLAANSFSGLYTYNAEGVTAPACAEGYTVSEDGLTYTVTLKDGLKWSDGSDLTAADFEYSWKRAAADETAADYAYMFSGFAGFGEEGGIQVTAVDDKTLEFVLSAPCAYIEDLMAFPTFYPVKQSAVEAAEGWETSPGKWCTEAGFVSNGAYVCTGWDHDVSMTYEKNPYFWDADKVEIEKIEYMLSADDTAIFAAYRAGDLDLADSVPTDEIATLLENKDPEFHIADELGTYYVAFNCKSAMFDGMTPEQAACMRLGISMLIDRDYICENIGQTGQVAANSFLPLGMADGNGGIFKPTENDNAYFDAYAINNDPEGTTAKAIEYLEAAGFKFEDGKLSAETPIHLNYLTNESTGHIAVAESMQQDFAAIGITMDISKQDWNVFLEERKQGNFDIAREGWIADFNDPINMLEMWTTDSGNNDCQFGR